MTWFIKKEIVTVFKTLMVCLWTTIISMSARGQEGVAPLLQNQRYITTSAKLPLKESKESAISLPFFEDFIDSSMWVNSDRWLPTKQVYVNRTMARMPVSYGVVTFDAINEWGMPYDTTNRNNVTKGDTLTSQPILLGSHTIGDSIYLSFFIQAGGNGFLPEAQDSFLCQFKNDQNNWETVWSTPGITSLQFNQILIPVNDAKWMHDQFQFRFVNKVSVGLSDDVWNLDYIRLHANRHYQDTLIEDIAFSDVFVGYLNNYASIPYWQFLASTNAVGNQMYGYATNQSNYTGPVDFNFKATANGQTLGTESYQDFIGPNGSMQVTFQNYATHIGTYQPYQDAEHVHTFTLTSPGGNNIQSNDTLQQVQRFSNYLAYDDGTAEKAYFLNLSSTLPGKLVVKFDLPTADTLYGLAVYFGRQVPSSRNKTIALQVYQSIAIDGQLDDLLYQEDNVEVGYRDEVNAFWYYRFSQPVPVSSGTFYAGVMMPAFSGTDSLYFGLDMNYRGADNFAYYNVLNQWSPSLIDGAVMIRPLLGRPIIGSAIEDTSYDIDISIFPNPSKGIYNLQVPAGNDLQLVNVYNLYGQNIYCGNSNFVDIVDQANGQYIVEMIFKNGRKARRILSKTE